MRNSEEEKPSDHSVLNACKKSRTAFQIFMKFE